MVRFAADGYVETTCKAEALAAYRAERIAEGCTVEGDIVVLNENDRWMLNDAARYAWSDAHVGWRPFADSLATTGFSRLLFRAFFVLSSTTHEAPAAAEGPVPSGEFAREAIAACKEGASVNNISPSSAAAMSTSCVGNAFDGFTPSSFSISACRMTLPLPTASFF